MAHTLDKRPGTARTMAHIAAFGLFAFFPAGTPMAHSAMHSSGSSTAMPGIAARRVVGALDQPAGFTFGPHDRLWYVEKPTGEVRVHNLTTGHDRRVFRVSGVNAEGERGALGIALDPHFPARPYVYVFATRSVQGSLRNQILRIRSSHGRGTTSKVIFDSPASSSPYHNGGRILFGPDDMLYAIVGEGHDPSNSQDRAANDRGKLLRMTPTGRVPQDNPFPRSRIFAYGIRNSFGFAFDPKTEAIWETENGPECNDELNLIRAGRNYGWGPHESCSGQPPGDTNQDGPDPQLPKLWYTPTIAPTGIAFCDSCSLGSASEGTLFFGAYNTSSISRVTLNQTRDDVASERVVYTHPSAIISLEVGPRGAIYFSDFTGIYKLVAG